jgi:hypothetical protein
LSVEVEAEELEVVSADDLLDKPSWDFSKSLNTRSRAASTARAFSSAASTVRASSFCFCFLMSRL